MSLSSRRALLVGKLSALVFIALTVGTSHAEPAPPVRSVGVLIGYAAEGQTFVDLPTAYRFGFGARGGVSFGHLYLGGLVVHHVGTTQSAYGVGNTFEARYHRTLIAPEIGYEATWKHFVLRPYLTAGVIYWYARTTAGRTTVDDTKFLPLLSPGLVAAFRFGPAFFGADLRAILAPLDQPRYWAAAVYGTLGFTF